MKFGHAEASELDAIDFTLPADNPQTIKVLGAKMKKEFNLYIGCGKWGIKEWVGDIYPEGTKEKDFLEKYKETFNSVELNNTFYRLSRPAIESWAETVAGRAFKFCPKWSRRVSHIRRIKDSDENTKYFIDSCELFGNTLGQTFLQLPENFGMKNFERLEPFLDLIPKGFPLQIEFRHKEWFEEDNLKTMSEILEKRGFGLVITDTAMRRDAVHQRLTNKVAFIRFNGYSLHKSDNKRLDDWVGRIEEWIDNGLEACYFFCHQKDEKDTLVNCRYLIKQLNDKLDFDLKIPPSY